MLFIFDNLALSWKEGRRRIFLLLLSKEEEYVFSTNILVMQMEEEEIFHCPQCPYKASQVCHKNTYSS